MNYSTIKVKIRKPEYYEILQLELLEYANFISDKTNDINFLDAFILLEIISKLNLRLRNIIEKHKKPKSISLSVSESVILIKIINSKPRRIGALEDAILMLITEKLKQELFNRST